MRLNCAGDLHVALLGMTLSAATMAGETSDARELERERRGIMRHVLSWVEHNRSCVLAIRPDLADMCAFECVETLAGEGDIPEAIAGELKAWAYAERMLSTFVIRSTTTSFPGVRLAYMHQVVHKETWPAVA